MCQAQPRTEQGSISFIERKYAIRRMIIEPLGTAPHQAFLDARSAQQRTFEPEKHKLIKRVHQSKAEVEFKAVYDGRWINKTYMLRPKVPMSLDDFSFSDPLFQKGAVVTQSMLKLIEQRI